MFSSTYMPHIKAFPFFIPEKKRQFKLKFQLRTDFVVLPVVSPAPFTAVKYYTYNNINEVNCNLVASLAEGAARQQ